MNTQEILNKIEQLPSHLIDKKVVISKDSVLELVRQLDDRPKVKIPQFVADWLIAHDWRCDAPSQSIIDVLDNLRLDVKNGYYKEVWGWIQQNGDILAQAWLDGYEVEHEKRYKVKIPSLYEDEQVLHFSLEEEFWYFGHDCNDNVTINKDSRYHTKAELKQAGFGGVFANSMFEVEEVE